MQKITVFVACDADGVPLPLSSAVGAMYIANPTADACIERAGKFGFEGVVARPFTVEAGDFVPAAEPESAEPA